jgi:uncharacterized LabA/DUF88 family protein
MGNTQDEPAGDVKHEPGRHLKRVAIFIDGSNLYHSLDENCKRFDLDFAAFAKKLCDGRSLYRTYYYNVQRDPERNPQAYLDQQRFLGALYNTAYLEVRLGGYKLRGDVAVEKGIDIMLATDLLRLAWSDLYDVGIVVSGDGDFAYAVQAAKDLGKHVVVAAFQANLSGELANVADDRQLFVPEYFEELWSSKRNPRKSAPRVEQQQSDGNGRRRGWRLGRSRRVGVSDRPGPIPCPL